MNGIWIWRYRDFELWHGMKYHLAREERGKKYPAVWEIGRCAVSVRIQKDVELACEEAVTVQAEGDCYIQVDGTNRQVGNILTVPAGKHRIRAYLGNLNGMCALKLTGETVFTDESWIADAMDEVWEPVGSSALCSGLPGKPGEYELPEEEIPVMREERGEGECLLDLGRETFVRVGLSEKKTAAPTNLFYGESREECYSDECVITDTVTGQQAVLPPRACRFLRLTGETDVKLRFLHPYLPKDDRSRFSCADDRMKEIWDMSKYTLDLCSRLFLLDGIKRDRWVWSGDVYISSLMNWYSFSDADLVKRSLIQLRGNQTFHIPINTIVDYSLYWVLTIKDLYFYTGESDFIRRNYGMAKELMQWYIDRRDAEGFIPVIPDTWLFIDWHEMTKEGDLCAIQMLFGAALEAMSEFAGICDRAEDARYYAELARGIREKIDRFYWREDLGAYVTTWIPGGKCDEVRRHQNYFAILYDYAHADKIRKIRKNVMENPDVPQITTPYFRFFEYDAQCRCGMIAEALQGMREYWGGMIDAGATSVWEEYDPALNGTEHYAMYGHPFDKSLCHAWGAGPVYFYGRYLAGVKPTSPGFKSYEVKPFTGLGDFTMNVPVPGGSIEVEVRDGAAKVTEHR